MSDYRELHDRIAGGEVLLLDGAVSTELLPGDVAEAILGQQATPEAVEAIRQELQLHRPAPVRYLDWLSGCLSGDLGRSLANGREVAELVSGRLGRSLTLAAVAALIAIPLAVGLGLVAALYEDRLTDKGISATTLAFVSMPEFLVGYILLYVFAVKLGWLPALSRLSDARHWQVAHAATRLLGHTPRAQGIPGLGRAALHSMEQANVAEAGLVPRLRHGVGNPRCRVADSSHGAAAVPPPSLRGRRIWARVSTTHPSGRRVLSEEVPRRSTTTTPGRSNVRV